MISTFYRNKLTSKEFKSVLDKLFCLKMIIKIFTF